MIAEEQISQRIKKLTALREEAKKAAIGYRENGDVENAEDQEAHAEICLVAEGELRWVLGQVNGYYQY